MRGEKTASSKSYVNLVLTLSYRGFELAPSSAARKSELDDIPKSMRRVLDGERIQKEWRDKKRKREESGDKGDDEGRGAKKAKSIEIKVRLVPEFQRWI